MTSSSSSTPAALPPPVDSIDWNNIGFKIREGRLSHPSLLLLCSAGWLDLSLISKSPSAVAGHVEAHFSHSAAEPRWSSPQLVKSPYLPIHGLAPGLNYGQHVYEGLKAFRHPGDRRITVFRPHRNAARMQHSARTVAIPPVPEDLFLRCVRLAVAANAPYVPPHASGGGALYVRPLLFGSSAQLGLSPPDAYTFAVFVLPVGVYHGTTAVDGLIVEDFDRAAPRGTGSAKVGGNYAPVLRHSERARARGFGITLHLDSATRAEIDEFSTSAFVGVRRDKDPSSSSSSSSPDNANASAVTIVVPDSKNAIDSVTSASVRAIASEMFGYRVEERRVGYDELAHFTEVMAAGTATALVPLRSVTLESRGDRFTYDVGDGGQGGPVFRELLSTLRGIQSGDIPDPFGWLVDVEPVDAAGCWGDDSGGPDDVPSAVDANIP